MSKYKIGFIDLDETLLSNGSVLSAESIEAINLLHKNKIIPVIATGRDKTGVIFLMNKLNIRYYILNNGANIFDSKENKMLFEKHFINENIMGILNKCKKENWNFFVYSEDGIFAKKKNLVTQIIAKRYFYHLNKIENVNNFAKLKIWKIYIPCVIKQKKAKYRKYMNNLNKKFEVFEFKYGWTINEKNVNKGVACKFILNLLKIDSKYSFAMGDNYNDIPMAQKVDRFISMHNSCDELNKIAYAESINSHEKRVLYAVKNYILKD